MLISLGNTYVGKDVITIEDYPFEPSSIFRNPEIPAGSIHGISLNARLTIHLAGELVPVDRNQQEHIVEFAAVHHIPITDDVWIWSWILEPFLDTEFSPEHSEQTIQRLCDFHDRLNSISFDVNISERKIWVQLK